MRLVPSLLQAMEQATQDQTAFPLRAKALGCFPHPARPRVLWVGLDDPSQALGRLNERLMAALTPLGFPPEDRPFHPHLTLARAQNRMPSEPALVHAANVPESGFRRVSRHTVASGAEPAAAGRSATYYFTLCDVAELRWILYPL